MEVQQTLQAIEITTTRFGMGGAAAQSQTSSADQAACPAGGVGAAAGGWSSAADRDAAIALINQIRTTLVDNGMMKGSA